MTSGRRNYLPCLTLLDSGSVCGLSNDLSGFVDGDTAPAGVVFTFQRFTGPDWRRACFWNRWLLTEFGSGQQAPICPSGPLLLLLAEA